MVLGLVRGGVLPGVVGGSVVPGMVELLPLVLRTREGGRVLPRVERGVFLKVGASELDEGGVVSSLDSDVVDILRGVVGWLMAAVSGGVVSGRDVGGEGVVVGSVGVVV